MSTIGQMNPFRPGSEDWTSYSERLEFFFTANKIADNLKKSTFLTVIGSETYDILASLVVPSKPGDKSYADLKTVLTNHFAPKRSQIFYRTQFYRCNQTPGTTVRVPIAVTSKGLWFWCPP